MCDVLIQYQHTLRYKIRYIFFKFWTRGGHMFTIIRDTFLNERLHIHNSPYIWTKMATKTDVSGQLGKVEGNLKISLWKITNQCD